MNARFDDNDFSVRHQHAIQRPDSIDHSDKIQLTGTEISLELKWINSTKNLVQMHA